MSEYNGWTNYETWSWYTWTSNDEIEHGIWLNEAISWIQYGQPGQAVQQLADQLETGIRAQLADTQLTGAFRDILEAALHDINYREIAAAYVEQANDVLTT